MTFSLDRFKLIYWDFDGVIKDSVSVKTDAFVELFKPYGEDVCDKVRRHHCANGGVSRYSKIPLYLKWSKVEVTDKKIDEFCSQFSEIVIKKVINSSWVPGVEDLLRSNTNKKFVLVSATPQKELEEICSALNLTHIFDKIFGSPANKSDVIKSFIINSGIMHEECLMIGDSWTDFNAAKDANIKFLLLQHNDNIFLSNEFFVETIENFLDIE